MCIWFYACVICVSVYLNINIILSVYMCSRMSICVVCLCVSISVHLFVCLFVYICVSASACVPVHQYVGFCVGAGFGDSMHM